MILDAPPKPEQSSEDVVLVERIEQAYCSHYLLARP